MAEKKFTFCPHKKQQKKKAFGSIKQELKNDEFFVALLIFTLFDDWMLLKK